MPIGKFIDSLTQNSPGRQRNRYLAERNALDLLEINLKGKDDDKSDYLTGQGNTYKMLIGQLTDHNITREELNSVKSSLDIIGKGFKESEYSDDVVVSSFHNFYESQLNEAMENVDESIQWRGELQGIVTALDNIPGKDKKTGMYNTQHTIDALNNITKLKSQYADTNADVLETLSGLEEIGVQRGHVIGQLQKYKEMPSGWEIANPTMASAVRAADEARISGDWNLAYRYLTNAAGSDVTDTKAGVKTTTQLKQEYNDRARVSFRRLTRYGESNPHNEAKMGTEYNQLHSQFASYPSSKSDWGEMVESSQIDRRFRTIVKRTIELDNMLGDITGGDLLGGNALKQHEGAFKDHMPSYGAFMFGMIMKGTGKGNYDYADGHPYMRGGEIQDGSAIGDYNMPRTKSVENTMRLNVENIIYDVSDGGVQSYVQETMAGDAEAYIETLPEWMDNEWDEPEQTPEEALEHQKEKDRLEKIEIKNANKKLSGATSRYNKLKSQKASLIEKVRKSKPIYADKESYDDKRIQGINASVGGAHKQFKLLNEKIKDEELEMRKLKKYLGDDISNEYNDDLGLQEIVENIPPLTLQK